MFFLQGLGGLGFRGGLGYPTPLYIWSCMVTQASIGSYRVIYLDLYTLPLDMWLYTVVV